MLIVIGFKNLKITFNLEKKYAMIIVLLCFIILEISLGLIIMLGISISMQIKNSRITQQIKTTIIKRSCHQIGNNNLVKEIFNI